MTDRKYYNKAKADGRLLIYRENRKRKMDALRARIADGSASEEDIRYADETAARRKAKAKASRERVASGTATDDEVRRAEQRKIKYAEWSRANAEHVSAQNKAWREANKDTVAISKKEWLRKNYPRLWEVKKAWRAAHPDKCREWRSNSMERLLKTPEKLLLKRLRGRVSGLELDPEDLIIPELCPLLGIPLKVYTGKRGAHKDSASVDRIDNTKGYVKGNVWVISHQANTMKSGATKQQLRAFCEAALKLLDTGALTNMAEG